MGQSWTTLKRLSSPAKLIPPELISTLNVMSQTEDRRLIILGASIALSSRGKPQEQRKAAKGRVGTGRHGKGLPPGGMAEAMALKKQKAEQKKGEKKGEGEEEGKTAENPPAVRAREASEGKDAEEDKKRKLST